MEKQFDSREDNVDTLNSPVLISYIRTLMPVEIYDEKGKRENIFYDYPDY